MKKSPVPWEFLARSQRGLWVKGVRTDESIDVLWKPRFQYEASVVRVIDYNGDIESEFYAPLVEWGDEWRLAGSIALTDQMVEAAGLENFEEFVFGLMRHVVLLVTCGHGDDLTEVIDWFSDFENRSFIVEDEYCVVDGHGVFDDLKGERIHIERDDGSMVARVHIRESEFVFDIDDPEVFVSFVISSVPV